MARICENCGKGGMVINWRSHSNIATKHRQQVNLQRKRLDGVNMKVCTKCIKAKTKKTGLRAARKAAKVAA